MSIDDWVVQTDPLEVDALVAEKVMGLKVLGEARFWKSERIEAAEDEDIREHTRIRPHYENDLSCFGYKMPVAHYSTDRSCLWDLLDRFEQWSLNHNVHRNYDCALWSIEMEECSYGESSNLNHAVIIAALRAVGVDHIDTASVLEVGQ